MAGRQKAQKDLIGFVGTGGNRGNGERDLFPADHADDREWSRAGSPSFAEASERRPNPAMPIFVTTDFTDRRSIRAIRVIRGGFESSRQERQGRRGFFAQKAQNAQKGNSVAERGCRLSHAAS